MKTTPIYGLDYHNVLFSYMGLSLRRNLKKNRDRPANLIIGRFIGKYDDSESLEFDDAVNAIRDIQNMIEDKMCQMISRKGIYYWFHLYRRIAPKETFGEDPQTLILYRNILECAFLKYGKINCGNEIVMSKPGHLINSSEIASGHFKKALINTGANKKMFDEKKEGIFLGKYDYNDALEIYQLERLAFEYWHTTVCYRRLNKGGKLIINRTGYFVLNDPEADRLIGIYDKRGTKFDDFSSSSGVLLNHKLLEANKGISLVPQYNSNEISEIDYPQQQLFLSRFLHDGDKEIIYNFVWVPFNFDYYYVANEFYSEEFLKTFGYRIEAFVQTLYSLIQSEVYFCLTDDRPVGRELLKRAYRRFSSIDKLVDNLIFISTHDKITSLSDYKLTKEDALSVLKNLSYNRTYRNNISLNTIGPRCLIFPSVDNGINVDYASVIFILRTMMHFLKPTEDKKGHLFEDVVIERLKTVGVPMWLNKKKLYGNDNTSREIDISFIIGDILFIAELKANVQSITYIEGNKATLQHRQKKNLEGIHQVEDKVKWLLNHNKGRNFFINENINYITSILVTPFTEYIWSSESDLWIDDEIPRVCTVSECCLLPKVIDIEDFKKKPYVMKLTKEDDF